MIIASSASSGCGGYCGSHGRVSTGIWPVRARGPAGPGPMPSSPDASRESNRIGLPDGVPRVTAELRDTGRRVSHKRVERVMGAFGIIGPTRSDELGEDVLRLRLEAVVVRGEDSHDVTGWAVNGHLRRRAAGQMHRHAFERTGAALAPGSPRPAGAASGVHSPTARGRLRSSSEEVGGRTGAD
ncbi:IS3 family transposase [Streptomyces sp. NPDC008121]|uniref:IS3 family transposase n=1 Tax=Streptomyces sp. NPDC008121 TaxID=3364809 RepID=UPI0036E3B43D